jgi:NUMOD4 motif.
MEEWKEIESFPVYSVSTHGRVRNDETGYFMALLRNQKGIINVGLTQNLVQYKRSVAVLVAHAFLPRPKQHTFDTPIHLDGDRGNNHVENLMWRPRWFAVKYHQQFLTEKRGFLVPVVDDSGEMFETSWEAATKYGLIDREILTATLNRTYVWPTYQKFRVISETDTH